MKKVTLNYRNTHGLSKLVRSLLSKGYCQSKRNALGGTGDTVFMIYNVKTGFKLEYTTKKREDNSIFINWARVSGREEIVNKFLTAVNYTEVLQSNF